MISCYKKVFFSVVDCYFNIQIFMNYPWFLSVDVFSRRLLPVCYQLRR
ncbi:hypothetical protein B194_0047 [Serratia plymuthica A30]|nr:hypothetical protein B194_0047 [Serratia plymuthica A30]